MAVDTARWQRLCEEYEELSATRRGLVQQAAQLHERLARARAEASRQEDGYRRRYGELPADARREDFLPEPSPPGVQRRATAADSALAVIAARSIVSDLARQVDRIEARLTPIRTKLSEMFALKEKCERWATANNIVLPGVGEPEHATVHLPSSGIPFDPGLSTRLASDAAARVSAAAPTRNGGDDDGDSGGGVGRAAGSRFFTLSGLWR